jgi:hypothetical protein
MIRACRNANALIAMGAALCLGGCAADTPRNGPFLALAQTLGIGTPSCSGHLNCADTQVAQSPIRVSKADYPPPALASPNRDYIGEEEPTGVPRLNVEASCRYSGDIGADTNLNRCNLDENGARDQLAHRWGEFSAADRSQCARYSTRSGGGTYTDLLTCLEMSLYVSELHAKRAFARQ